jgi:Beta-propeller repeat
MFGNVLWARQSFGSSNMYTPEQFGFSVATDKLGNVYMTGGFVDTAYFGSYELMASYFPDVFLIKYDSTGNVIWAKQSITTSGDGEGRSVAVDGKNNIYITGEADDSIVFASYKLHSPLFLAKYDPNGNVLWATAPHVYNGVSYSVAADSIGNAYITGFFLTLCI